MIFLDIIFLLFIAGIIFSRLWNVLGHNPLEKKNSGRTIHLKKQDVTIKKHATKKSDFYPGFSESAFLEGVENAFNTILDAHHKGDQETLKALVDSKILKETFGEQPTALPSKICLLSTAIEKKEVIKNQAFITVHFSSQQVVADETINAEDRWTFSRRIKDANPNWMLVGVA